jgi:hypothetical protein
MGMQASRSIDHGGLQIDRGDGPVVASFANDAKNSIAHDVPPTSASLKLGRPSD